MTSIRSIHESSLLVGDIGGTITRLAISRGNSLYSEKHYSSKDFPTLEEIIKKYRDELKEPFPKRACLAVAGAVEENRVKATNLRWTVDGEYLSQVFDLYFCRIINDFEAAAWGVLELDSPYFVKLGGEEVIQGTPKAVLGAGTGLGQAIIIPLGSTSSPQVSGDFIVIPTEGGHSDFAPKNQKEIRLLQFLMKEREHVSIEAVLSGPGLVTIYRFLHLEKENLKSTSCQEPSEITKHALEGDDSVCIEALDMFVSIYGSEAGNLALKTLARGGVYVAGGVAPRILPFLKKMIFRNAFEMKGRMRGLLEKIPVYVATHPRLGLIGASFVGRKI